ncbi:Digeranylgeranylglyceryl phosphate synthase [uncultured archaeon]|nr:Digeranylgeranylglyceryl phosphate synthase [uncultured archaeon]
MAEKKSAGGAVKAWLKLVRIEHALMSCVGVGIAMLLAIKQPYIIPNLSMHASAEFGFWPAPPLLAWLLALAVPFFINISSFALNDYFDIEADRKNGQLKRPLVSGALKPSVALWTAILGYAIGMLAGWLLNPVCGTIATIFTLLSIAYNYKLKDWPLVGNAYIALSMAIAFLFGAGAVMSKNDGLTGLLAMMTSFGWTTPLVLLFSPLFLIFSDGMPATILWLTAGAFFAGLAREIIKSVQDMEGDKKARNSKHLPILIGAQNALAVASVCVVGYSVCVAQLAGLMKDQPLTQFLLILSGAAYAAIALVLWKWAEKDYMLELARKASLYALMLALVAMLVGAI